MSKIVQNSTNSENFTNFREALIMLNEQQNELKFERYGLSTDSNKAMLQSKLTLESKRIKNLNDEIKESNFKERAPVNLFKKKLNLVFNLKNLSSM